MKGREHQAGARERLALAHENVRLAEDELETALKVVESATRADKRIISAALRAAFDKLAVARVALEALLAPGAKR